MMQHGNNDTRDDFFIVHWSNPSLLWIDRISDSSIKPSSDRQNYWFPLHLSGFARHSTWVGDNCRRLSVLKVQVRVAPRPATNRKLAGTSLSSARDKQSAKTGGPTAELKAGRTWWGIKRVQWRPRSVSLMKVQISGVGDVILGSLLSTPSRPLVSWLEMCPTLSQREIHTIKICFTFPRLRLQQTGDSSVMQEDKVTSIWAFAMKSDLRLCRPEAGGA